jgi:hypothetical protein
MNIASLFAKSTSRQGADERDCNRFPVPGATLSCTEQNIWRQRTQFGDKCPILDIGKGGLSFLADSPPRQNSTLDIQIHVPDFESPLAVKAEAVYVIPRGAQHSYRYRIGVQFLPFGAQRSQNQLKILKAIEQLEKIYLKPAQEQKPAL